MALRLLTAGESHGKALLGILEGIPSGLGIEASDIQKDLARRKLGFGRGHRQKIEDDAIQILSGIRHGKTLGSPIGLLIENRDYRNWQECLQPEPTPAPVKREVFIPRPGHADLVGGIKYDHNDMRNVLERASARETTMRVALGAIARELLKQLGIELASRVTEIAGIADASPLTCPVADLNAIADASPVRCLDSVASHRMVEKLESLKSEGNTAGGLFEVYASALPVGLGSYAQWDRRIEGAIAEAFLSLNAIKGVEIGLGKEVAHLPGSQAHDEISLVDDKRAIRFATNRAGGIEGGMTTGQTLIVRAAMKPLSTLMKPLRSVDLRDFTETKAHIERSDVCAVPAAAVIGEALLAIVLANAVMDKFGGDSMRELKPRVEAWNAACPIG